jgi:hypothetical protein
MGLQCEGSTFIQQAHCHRLESVAIDRMCAGPAVRGSAAAWPGRDRSGSSVGFLACPGFAENCGWHWERGRRGVSRVIRDLGPAGVDRYIAGEARRWNSGLLRPACIPAARSSAELAAMS